jgi:hypothetical protein
VRRHGKAFVFEILWGRRVPYNPQRVTTATRGGA